MSKFKAHCSFIKDLYESASSNLELVINTEHELWGHVRTIEHNQIYHLLVFMMVLI